MKKVTLSICIPTYNRRASLEDLLHRILDNNDLQIEVVVVDNGSTDGTDAMLAAFVDERLKCYFNGENKGISYNILRAIECATGKYALICNDRDIVLMDKLPAVIRFLADADYGVVYTKFGINKRWRRNQKGEKKAGYEAASIDYTSHPTGVILNRELLDYYELDIYKFLKPEYILGVYVWAMVERELKIRNGCYYYEVSLTSNRGSEYISAHRSHSKEKVHKALWFQPQGVYNIVEGGIVHICSLKETRLLTAAEIDKLVYGMIGEFYSIATSGYKAIMRNEVECAHYGIEPRRVPWSEVWEKEREYVKFTMGLLNKYNVKHKGYYYFRIMYMKAILIARIVKYTMKGW